MDHVTVMILPLLLAMTGAPPTGAPVPSLTLSAEGGSRAADDVQDAIDEADGDVAALGELAATWAASDREDAARRVWSAILEIDEDHEAAHEGLRHHRYDGRWFTTYAELSAAKRAEAARRLKEDGVVPFQDEWVLAEDLPFRRMGWEKLDDGEWAPPGTAARRAEEQKLVADGWQRQHRTWIPPREFEHWKAGKWKVGDEWLDTAAANEAHADLSSWWEIPGENFVVLTTLTEENARWALYWADQTRADLLRMFGLEPNRKPEFAVLNSIAQYNDFAAGSAAEQRRPADAGGLSAVHYAFFTDGWMDVSEGRTRFRGTGAAYYDAQDPVLAPFGQHAIRHAAALAWIEAIDPSWNAVSLMVTAPRNVFFDASFWDEKRIPRWMRYGAAAYCERFFEDKTVGEGGDPLWARKWATENLAKGGPLRSVPEIVEFDLDPLDPERSARLIHEAGVLVHYMLDSGDDAVTAAHGAVREALIAGEDTSDAVETLVSALEKAERKIDSFTGL